MSKKFYYSRARYVLAHAFVQQYFESLPNLAFLQDFRNERQCFQRYLQWGPLSQNWTYWQKSLLYNLYERKRALQDRKKPQKIFGNLTFWGLLLKFYLYSSENPVTLNSFLEGHPYLSDKIQSEYKPVVFQGYLPEFKIVLKKCHEPLLEQPRKTLFFSHIEKARGVEIGLKDWLPMDRKLGCEQESVL